MKRNAILTIKKDLANDIYKAFSEEDLKDFINSIKYSSTEINDIEKFLNCKVIDKKVFEKNKEKYNDFLYYEIEIIDKED